VPAVALPFALGAVHHALALTRPGARDGSSPARHGVFFAINLLFAALYARRVRWTLAPAALLALQQQLSHGSAFLAARSAGAFDAESFAVLLFVPIFLGAAALLLRAPATEP